MIDLSIFDLFKKIESERKPPAGKPEWIIAGLGNPGKEYETSRHNTGFIALDTLSGMNKIDVRELKFKALCGRGEIAGQSVLLLKPQTFMNLSGDAIVQAASFIKYRWNVLLSYMMIYHFRQEKYVSARREVRVDTTVSRI